jgi:diketogulonate reductase-like aldo/keto reductase
LGVSNISPSLLSHLYTFAKVKPVVVQNRFYADTDYDSEMRAFCAKKGIRYQSFWTLTANPALLRSDVVGKVADRIGTEEAVALYALVLGLGDVSVLNGTTNAARMKGDLEGVEKARKHMAEYPRAWDEHMADFKKLLR